jgi:regulator of sigma E protease
MLSYLAPILVFGLVIFVHELGHFLAAKATGVYAPVFSLGWGRRIFGVRRGETDYRVSIFPLGGYVRMASREDESMAGIEGGTDRGELDASAADDGGATAPAAGPLWDNDSMAPFGPKAVPADRWVENKPVPARLLILSAGVMMNILLTLVVASGIFLVYGNSYRPAVIEAVVPGAPAANAGIQAGDQIVAIDGQAVRGWDQVLERVSPITSGSVTLDIVRGGEQLSRVLTPEVAEGADPVTGAKRQVGRIGIQVRDSIARESVGPVTAVALGSRATWRMATTVGDVLKGLVTREVEMSNLGGPIAIARTSVQAARGGAEMFWSLIAFLSLNIAILNLVPIPVLDGGQILIVLAEAVKGSEFSSRTREMLARVGVLAVIALIVLVFYNDIRNLIST